MTREEAIAILQEEIDGNLELSLREWQERDEQKLFPAFRMAIEALQQEPVVHCKDCFYLDEDEFENGDVVLFCNFMRAELNDMEMNNESYCSNGEMDKD